MIVDAHDPAFGGDRMHEANAMLVKQCIELPPESAEATGLHLDQFTIRTHEVNYEAADRHLKLVARLRQDGFDCGVQRPFAHHPDTRHAAQARHALGTRFAELADR